MKHEILCGPERARGEDDVYLVVRVWEDWPSISVDKVLLGKNTSEVIALYNDLTHKATTEIIAEVADQAALAYGRPSNKTTEELDAPCTPEQQENLNTLCGLADISSISLENRPVRFYLVAAGALKSYINKRQ